MRKKGFTLIELLVVIGIIGILAAGILAAIDPLEQLKKGRDSQKRSVCVELFNAFTRYYAINGEFPWGAETEYGAKDIASVESDDGYVTDLINVGELKSEFMEGLTAGSDEDIYVYGSDEDTMVICFDPESKGVSSDPTTIYGDNEGTVDTTNCPDVDEACYWCAR